MFHSIPELQSLSSIKRELAAKIELLRETSDKITGFICGGLELNKSNKSSVDSFNLYNKIADSLDEFDIPFTMMCGKEKGACPDNLYSNANSVLVWNNDFKDIFKNTKKLSQDEIVSMLENRYQFVERNSSQEFKICDSPTKVYNG